MLAASTVGPGAGYRPVSCIASTPGRVVHSRRPPPARPGRRAPAASARSSCRSGHGSPVPGSPARCSIGPKRSWSFAVARAIRSSLALGRKSVLGNAGARPVATPPHCHRARQAARLRRRGRHPPCPQQVQNGVDGQQVLAVDDDSPVSPVQQALMGPRQASASRRRCHRTYSRCCSRRQRRSSRQTLTRWPPATIPATPIRLTTIGTQSGTFCCLAGSISTRPTLSPCAKY